MALDNKDNIDTFINDKLSDLLEELKDSYGPVLFEELKSRIHFTISEFNEEMQSAFLQLKDREANRQKMYEMIKEGNIPPEPSENSDSVDEDVNSWGNKIDNIES